MGRRIGRPGEPLTARERDLLALIATGNSNAAIGRHLHMAEDTINQLLRTVYEKLGARDRAHAVHLAHLVGHIRPEDPQPATARFDDVALPGLETVAAGVP